MDLAPERSWRYLQRVKIPSNFVMRTERLSPLWTVEFNGGDFEAVIHEVCHLATLQIPFPTIDEAYFGYLPDYVSDYIGFLPSDKSRNWDEAKALAAQSLIHDALGQDLDLQVCLDATSIFPDRYSEMERRVERLRTCKSTLRNAESAISLVLNQAPEIPSQPEAKTAIAKVGLVARLGSDGLIRFWSPEVGEVWWSKPGEGLPETWYRYQTSRLHSGLEEKTPDPC